MRAITLTALIITVLLVLTSVALSDGAKVYIEETTFNYGLVPQTATVTHSFFIHNYGTDTLRILKVRPG